MLVLSSRLLLVFICASVCHISLDVAAFAHIFLNVVAFGVYFRCRGVWLYILDVVAFMMLLVCF